MHAQQLRRNRVIIKTSERGFSLIELVIVVALVVIVTTATIGLIASVSKRSDPGINRDLATMAAQNALERARSAAAYFPKAATPQESSTVATIAASPSNVQFILQPTSSFVVNNPLPPSTCGINGGAVASLPLTVTTSLAGNTFDVKVTYPTVACDVNSATATVEMSEILPPPSYIPGTRIYEALAGEPTQQ
jgi:prepilin-type N-terminal cleavage/methylation domain-containing protein